MKGYGYNPWSYFNTISMIQRVTNGSLSADVPQSDWLSVKRRTYAGNRSISD